MLNKNIKIGRWIGLASAALLVGCAANGGYPTSNLAGFGAQSTSPVAAVEGALMNSVIQSMGGNVLNGQIGSQIPSTDQNFRLQQLGNMVQSGAVNQSQQWTNPQTGNAIAVNPMGQNAYNHQYQQQCQPMQEVVTLQNGQSITENRLACQNPQTGQWTLVQ